MIFLIIELKLLNRTENIIMVKKKNLCKIQKIIIMTLFYSTTATRLILIS